MERHLSGKAIAATMDRLDALLRLATLANRLADRHDPLRENPFADKSAGPQLLEKLALGDDAIAMLQEIREDVDGGSSGHTVPARRSSYRSVSSVYAPKA